MANLIDIWQRLRSTLDRDSDGRPPLNRTPFRSQPPEHQGALPEQYAAKSHPVLLLGSALCGRLGLMWRCALVSSRTLAPPGPGVGGAVVIVCKGLDAGERAWACWKRFDEAGDFWRHEPLLPARTHTPRPARARDLVLMLDRRP